jgi:hypothetical protein
VDVKTSCIDTVVGLAERLGRHIENFYAGQPTDVVT